ncbi:hypothetical protein EIP91_011689 [Steccherinum ochraceum]|uniref:Uncharacterized protein n=1 Tax=Steccherinum ochraceum TaxID=92696 RepID=A0A4R0RQZ3_9APHY|nr:hypothetical protein EIP91_011689 [Steccherinum ochraceum]
MKRDEFRRNRRGNVLANKRNECAACRALGTLLPYSYGFHKFQIPTGHNVYGFLTEDVHGVPLPAPEDLPDIDLQRRMVRHLNLVERTLLYKGVGKHWYFESVTVTELPTDAGDPTSFRVVVSDCALARLRLGQDLYFPPMQEPVAEMYVGTSDGPWQALGAAGYELTKDEFDEWSEPPLNDHERWSR